MLLLEIYLVPNSRRSVAFSQWCKQPSVLTLFHSVANSPSRFHLWLSFHWLSYKPSKISWPESNIDEISQRLQSLKTNVKLLISVKFNCLCVISYSFSVWPFCQSFLLCPHFKCSRFSFVLVAKFIEVVINCCQVCNLKSSLVFVVGKISAYNERLSCKWYYLSFLEILSWRIPSNDERLPLTRENTLFCKMCHSFLFGCVDLKRRVPSDAWIALQSCLPYETNGTDQIPIFSFQRVVLWLKKFKPWNENWQPWYLRQKIASLFAFTLNQFQGLPVEISFSC